MQTSELLDPFPMWLLFLLTVALAITAVEIGYRVARYRVTRYEGEQATPVGGMVGATLGLFAFMLAFTFGLAGARFESRRQLVLSEANAIGTAYLRAKMLPEPMRSDAQNTLREYVDVRLEGIEPGKLEQSLKRSDELQQQMWAEAIATAEKERTAITSLFIQSINQVIELHGSRVMAGLQSRIPSAIWVVLYLLVGLAMAAVGYHQGLTSTRRSLVVITLVLGFSAVLVLIVDLDRPGRGSLQVSQQSMINLRNSMNQPQR